MDLYRIEINGVPKIDFAYSTSTDKYSNSINARGSFEISLIDGGMYRNNAYGREYDVKEKSLSVWVPDLYCETSSVDDSRITMTGVVFTSLSYVCERYVINSKKEWEAVKSKVNN